MAKKEFSFRGKSFQELEAMPLAEFAKLCNSRQRKSLMKGMDAQFKHFLKKVEASKKITVPGKGKPVKTHKRDIIILPSMVGAKLAIHRGNTFDTVDVNEKMIGHYLGEFVLTRKKLQHGKAGIGATKSSTAITAR
jgi:small subunit ribosomal protein S19